MSARKRTHGVMVAQLTFNQPGEGSSPSGSTKLSVCSSVWLECLVWNEDAEGSNPSAQTNFIPCSSNW
jgi:hypothetical protein